ncbi:hypothetical protein TWF694_005702 [Orbilia ellipsospora]|uniref:Uncharacterized protein n=1 Tax=Orbilia ellipsospora TaxID=2528407 RepID=A0AAV9WRW3_9PEZI
MDQSSVRFGPGQGLRSYLKVEKLEAHKDFILEKRNAGAKHKDIITALRVEKGILLKPYHLKRVLKVWNVSNKNLTIRRKLCVRNGIQERLVHNKPAPRVWFKRSGRELTQAEMDGIVGAADDVFQGVMPSPAGGDIILSTPTPDRSENIDENGNDDLDIPDATNINGRAMADREEEAGSREKEMEEEDNLMGEGDEDQDEKLDVWSDIDDADESIESLVFMDADAEEAISRSDVTKKSKSSDAQSDKRLSFVNQPGNPYEDTFQVPPLSEFFVDDWDAQNTRNETTQNADYFPKSNTQHNELPLDQTAENTVSFAVSTELESREFDEEIDVPVILERLGDHATQSIQNLARMMQTKLRLEPEPRSPQEFCNTISRNFFDELNNTLNDMVRSAENFDMETEFAYPRDEWGLWMPVDNKMALWALRGDLEYVFPKNCVKIRHGFLEAVIAEFYSWIEELWSAIGSNDATFTSSNGSHTFGENDQQKFRSLVVHLPYLLSTYGITHRAVVGALSAFHQFTWAYTARRSESSDTLVELAEFLFDIYSLFKPSSVACHT